MNGHDEILNLEMRALLRWAADELPAEHLQAAMSWMSDRVREPLWYVRPHVAQNERLQHIQRLKKVIGLDYIAGPWTGEPEAKG